MGRFDALDAAYDPAAVGDQMVDGRAYFFFDIARAGMEGTGGGEFAARVLRQDVVAGVQLNYVCHPYAGRPLRGLAGRGLADLILHFRYLAPEH